MSGDDDRDLRDAFHTLGSEVRDRGPTFAQLASPAALRSARSRQRQRQRQRHAMLLLAAIVIPASLVLRARADRGLDYARFTALTGLDLNSVTWEAPSDYLLDIPGRELLRAVPRLGVIAPPTLPDSARSSDSNDTRRRPRS